MANLRLTLEYDGTGFHGWARQPGRRTVEGVLREGLARVLPSVDGLAVAGRTDAGVHATGQVVTLVGEGGPPVERLAEALNAVLPDDLAVVAAAAAPHGLHARFSATSRSYRYRVRTSPVRSPLAARRVLWWPRRVDHERLAEQAALLPGEHDFTAFTPAETEHHVLVRSIRRAGWERVGDDELHFTVTADSFLRHMVRTLVGTMLQGRDLAPLLGGRPRAEGGQTAPPWGLYLEHVAFADDDLADALLAGTLERPLSHAEHVRVAIVVVRRLGPAAGGEAMRDGLRGLCGRLGVPGRFDPALTDRWLGAVAPLALAEPRGSVDDLLRTHPRLLRADLHGLPAAGA